MKNALIAAIVAAIFAAFLVVFFTRPADAHLSWWCNHYDAVWTDSGGVRWLLDYRSHFNSGGTHYNYYRTLKELPGGYWVVVDKHNRTGCG